LVKPCDFDLFYKHEKLDYRHLVRNLSSQKVNPLEFYTPLQADIPSRYTTLLFTTLLVGITAGISGSSVVLLLHYIQHLAYGYSLEKIITNQTFLIGVEAASPERRITLLVLCGILAGLGWSILYRYGNKLVSIKSAIDSSRPSMPLLATLCHILLQITTIALGSPLGREVAPRELSILCAGFITAKTKLSLAEVRVILCCAAGAGLATVYNIPLAGAIFSVEVLLQKCSFWALLAAFSTSFIAVALSWTVLGNHFAFLVSDAPVTFSLMVWSIVSCPIIGISAYWFRNITASARKTIPGGYLSLLCILNFTLMGLVAIYFPSLLGNGKSIAELSFDNQLGIALTLLILFLRVTFTWSSLRVGAKGGLLMPSIAIGALLGGFSGGIWNVVSTVASPLSAYALIGAAGFLAVSQKMPLTAIVAIFELTGIHYDFGLPVMSNVIGTICLSKLLEKSLSKNNFPK
jgi:H+/Cl- antiporter ClcA